VEYLILLEFQYRHVLQVFQRVENFCSGHIIGAFQNPERFEQHHQGHEQRFACGLGPLEAGIDEMCLRFVVAHQKADEDIRVERNHDCLACIRRAMA
jgi:hypothetical protein